MKILNEKDNQNQDLVKIILTVLVLLLFSQCCSHSLFIYRHLYWHWPINEHPFILSHNDILIKLFDSGYIYHRYIPIDTPIGCPVFNTSIFRFLPSSVVYRKVHFTDEWIKHLHRILKMHLCVNHYTGWLNITWHFIWWYLQIKYDIQKLLFKFCF